MNGIDAKQFETPETPVDAPKKVDQKAADLLKEEGDKLKLVANID